MIKIKNNLIKTFIIFLLSINFLILLQKYIYSTDNYFKPSQCNTWYIQLDNELKTNINTDIYDIDLFDTSKETIQKLKINNIKVICYFNAGAFENWREDADEFDLKDIGKPLSGWEGEYWLNIKSDKVKKIMKQRLKLAKEKGCDGVDPDNVNGFINNTGFNITYNDQLKYNIFLANEAHKLGLSVGLKNDLFQIKDLVSYFDFAINEECHQFNECDILNPFIENEKPVFNIEYSKDYINNNEKFRKLCEDSFKRKFKTVVMSLGLNGSLYKSCNSTFPNPIIKINGSSNACIISNSENFLLTVSLISGIKNKKGDYFFWIKIPSEVCYCLQIPFSWELCDCKNPKPVYQGDIISFKDIIILSIKSSIIPSGKYKINFAIDLLPNGIYNKDNCSICSILYQKE